MLEYMKRLREPYAGKPPVRFDEGENDNGQRREYLSTRIVLSTLLNLHSAVPKAFGTARVYRIQYLGDKDVGAAEFSPKPFTCWAHHSTQL